MEFPYDKIVKLAERIGNMKDKKYKNDLKQIKKIIENTNPDIKDKMTKNNNGYFLPDFESYNYKTYVELTRYLDEIDERMTESENKQNSIYFSEITDRSDNANKKLKYTNSENHILNKRKYDEALKKHQSECEEQINSEENEKLNKLKKLFIRENNDSDSNKNKSNNIFKKHIKNDKDKKSEKSLL